MGSGEGRVAPKAAPATRPGVGGLSGLTNHLCHSSAGLCRQEFRIQLKLALKQSQTDMGPAEWKRRRRVFDCFKGERASDKAPVQKPEASSHSRPFVFNQPSQQPD